MAIATTYVTTNATTASTPVAQQIYDNFNDATNTAAGKVNDAIAASAANPGDPTSMIKMQVAISNYSIALSVQSSVIKSLEETAKSITQKL